MLSEFELIAKVFDRPARSALLGVGDDAALVCPREGMQLAVSTDLLLEGRHFHAGADPRKLGHKSLAVNLSDMAAMGATPRWATLAIALPAADEAWLAAFAEGLFALAGRYGTELIGGDTTRGPLAICITILGEVPPLEQQVGRHGELHALARAHQRRVVPHAEQRTRRRAIEIPGDEVEF